MAFEFVSYNRGIYFNVIEMTKRKSNAGRHKIVLSENQIKEVEELARDLTIEQIANYLGIGETTFYEIRKKDSRIQDAYKKGKSGGIKEAVGLLWKSMREGNVASIMFYLKTQARWRESKPDELDIQQVTSQPQFNFIVSNKTDNKLTDVTSSTSEINLKIKDISNGN